jgi:hypothetical protein
VLSDNGHKGKIVPRNSGLSAPSLQRRHWLEITVLAHNQANGCSLRELWHPCQGAATRRWKLLLVHIIATLMIW